MLEGLLRIDDLQLQFLDAAPLLKGKLAVVSFEVALQVFLGNGYHIRR
jgi:hypothetical protein